MFLNMRKSITLLLLLLGFGMGASAVKGQASITITEVMYRSPAVPDSLEFIEIVNTTAFSKSLLGYYFSAGVVFSFPNTMLPPGKFVIVCKDTTGFKSVFGPKPYLFQWTSGDLDDSGELVELKDQFSTAATFTYSPNAPWPTQGNGLGYSINFCDLNNLHVYGQAWEPAATPTGIVIGGLPIFANPGSCCAQTDNTPPSLLNYSFDGSNIGLKFSEPIGYEFHGAGITSYYYTGLPLGNSTLIPPNDSLTIQLAVPFAQGHIDTLHVGAVQDTACNAMTPIEIVLTYNTLTDPLEASEIMYDGLTGSIIGLDSMQFVEFVNPGPNSRPIGGLHVTGQIDVVLPELTLGVGEHVVLARSPELIERFFQIEGNVFYWNQGSINDNTGHFRVTNTAGVIIDSLTYRNLSPWPTGAQETGRSIVVCDPSQDNSLGSNWVESSTIIDSVGVWYGANIPGPIWASPGRANCRLVGIDNAEVIATKIYPNPFYSTFEIETKSLGLASALITDAMGRNIKIAPLVEGYVKVDLAGQPSGIYFVSLLDQDGRVMNVKKLIHY